MSQMETSARRPQGYVQAAYIVADVEQAFAQTWSLTGAPIEEQLPNRASLPVAGDVALRVVATIPATASLYRPSR